jgi:hypothetical protein
MAGTSGVTERQLKIAGRHHFGYNPSNFLITLVLVSRIVPKPSFEKLFWEEMCRREVWDREFENIFVEDERERSEKEQLKEEEYLARAAWDTEYRARKKATEALTATGKEMRSRCLKLV